VSALLGFWFSGASRFVDLPRILAPPGGGLDVSGWLGFDSLGRSVLLRLVEGSTTSCTIALGVVSAVLAAGTVVGAVSGFIGGWFDHLVIRVIDIFLAFPGMLLAIALAGALGPGVDNVVIALSAVGWVGFARLTRAQTLSLRRQPHVTAARALGVPAGRIIAVHVLPLVAGPLIVEATFAIASAVIAEAGLSFLGLGVQPPRSSWGSMLLEGAHYMLVAPHLVIAPAVAIFLVVWSINVLGDRFRDHLDVRR